MKFGIPTGFKDQVLAVLTDSSTSLKNKLNVLGFSWNPMGGFWARGGSLQPHVIKTLQSFGIQPSPAVIEEYNQKTVFRPIRAFEDNFKYEMLLDYQKEALEFCKNSGSGIVALDIGLGKTGVAIGYADFLGQKNLVVCPASLRGQWFNELVKFNNKEPNRIVIDGSKEKRRKQWKDAKNCQYVICSYDLMRQEGDLKEAKKYLDGTGLLIFDEIMLVKTSGSQRTKAIKELRESASLAIGLSGTPIENSLGEFYTILNIVSPNFLPSYERFAEIFLIRELKQGMGGKSYWVTHGEKNVDEFRDLIKPLVIRREKRECLDLPPASTVIRQVKLSKEQKRIEKKLLELAKEDPENILKYFTYARENIISPDLLPLNFEKSEPKGLDIWAKILEEGSGIEYSPSRIQLLLEGKLNPEEIELTPRLQEIASILVESGKEKIIIYSPYVKALELVKRCVLKEPCAMLIGGCNPEAEIEKFRGNTRVLLMSSSGETGHNLQMATLMLICDRPYNPGKLSQLRGRIERKGQTHPMTFYELNSSSVIESRVNKILEKKEKLSERVLAREVMK
jgi:SNF2 family DNA or RNA helicase